ncbi:ParB/RepB/Spo0J family partition protein [Nocardia sp. NPDC057227]|uniref:ParB/RepB/Spo0J family partition protein n=1 Tax=Nocardia sp. NPDC057227 TaxID=3346056 RepID=UPI00362ABDA1
MSTTALTIVTDTPDTDTDSNDSAVTAAAPDSDSTPVTATPVREAAERLDPNDLVIAENVRVSFDLDDHTTDADSIRTFGVRDPILAERQPDGSIHVINGQMRTLIARAVGLTSVPVWVTNADTGIDDTERRIERTLVQINLNDRRTPLTDADRAAGVALMLDLGATPTRVAEGLQRKRSEIRAAAAVGRSATARGLLNSGQHTLEQLAVIADYEAAGDTDAVHALTTAAHYQFGYQARRLAAERAETRARLHAALPYAAYGFGILTSEPDTRSTKAAFIPASELTTSEDPVGEEQIYADPARWVVFLQREEAALLVDTDTGADIEPATVDWDTEHDPDTTPAEGLRHASTVAWRDRWTPEFFLLVEQLGDSGLSLAAASEAADDQVRAEAAAAAAAREQARQDNRRVRQLNLRGVAAKERRQEFLREYLQRRTPPAQAAGFVATYLAEELDAAALREVTTALGVDGSRQALLDTIEAAPVNRTWVIVLAMVLATREAPIDKSFWRVRSAAMTRYLHLLAELADGLPADSSIEFALTDVDRAAAGDVDYREIDIDTLAA